MFTVEPKNNLRPIVLMPLKIFTVEPAVSSEEPSNMSILYKFWFRPELAEAIAERYDHISFNELLAQQPPSPSNREIWESILLDGLYVNVAHLGAELNQPTGCNFEVHVVHVLSNAPSDALIQLFKHLGGFYLNSVEVPG